MQKNRERCARKVSENGVGKSEKKERDEETERKKTRQTERELVERTNSMLLPSHWR